MGEAWGDPKRLTPISRELNCHVLAKRWRGWPNVGSNVIDAAGEAGDELPLFGIALKVQAPQNSWGGA
jgi:hypothetical protein